MDFGSITSLQPREPPPYTTVPNLYSLSLSELWDLPSVGLFSSRIPTGLLQGSTGSTQGLYKILTGFLLSHGRFPHKIPTGDCSRVLAVFGLEFIPV